jgi:hypothetical protein
LLDTIGSQQIARRSVGADNTQGNAATGKFSVQLVQHARTREIEIRCGGKIADDQPDDGGSCLAETA